MSGRPQPQNVHLQDLTLRRAAVERVVYRYGRQYPEINLNSVVYSADLEHLAFLTRDKRSVVVDGREYPGGDDVLNLRLSPDGRRFAYTTFHREPDGFSLGRWYVVVDGIHGPPLNAYYPLAHTGAKVHDSLSSRLWPDGGQPFPPCAHFSDNSSSVGYYGTAMDDPAWEVMVINGEVGPKFLKVSGLIFSLDGAHYVYQVKTDEATHVYSNGKLGPGFAFLHAPGLLAPPDYIQTAVLLPDGTPVYCGKHSNPQRECLMRGDEVLLSAFSLYDCRIDEQGRLVGCFVADDRDNWRMHTPAGNIGSYTYITDVIWTADHLRYAFVGVDGLVTENLCEEYSPLDVWQEEPQDQASNAPVVAPTVGEPWHWATHRERLTVFPEVDDAPPVLMGVRYSADGARRWHVCADGQELCIADGIGARSLQFSPDGRRLGWVEVVDGEGFVALDGQRHGPYQDIEPGSLSVSGSGATFIALCGDEWREITLP